MAKTNDSMAASDTILEARGLSKAYNKNSQNKETVQALQDVSMSVNDNEFVVILGPSGCGKTTLLRIFGGLVDIDEGKVLAQGEPITKPSMSRAMVFQRFNLFPWRSVIENVAFGLEMRGDPKGERNDTAQKFIEMVGLEGFENSYPNELSGGMQQRVGLARALAVDPEILLMDEPFGALDAQTREQMQEELLEIWEQNKKTIIFVTHDIDESLLLADRIFIMGINPRQIVEEISVSFGRPRYDTKIQGSEGYQNLKDDIWDVLRGFY